MRRWLREGWKHKLAMAIVVVSGIAYAVHRLYQLGGKGMVLRGGLIEGVLIFFGGNAAAMVIVLGSVYLSKVLYNKYHKEPKGKT